MPRVMQECRLCGTFLTGYTRLVLGGVAGLSLRVRGIMEAPCMDCRPCIGQLRMHAFYSVPCGKGVLQQEARIT